MKSLWMRVTSAHVEFVTTGYVRLVEPIARVLIRLGVSANALTTFGTVCTALGGVAFGLGHIRTGAWVIGFTAVADALDGIVARGTGRVTKFGAFYDSTLDRIGDGALLGGLAFFYGANPLHANQWMLAVSLAGLVGTFTVSYARARAEALGLRGKVGKMQRAERVALLCIPQAFFGLALNGWVLDIVVVLLTASAWHTAWLRIRSVYHESAETDAKQTAAAVSAPPRPQLRIVTDKNPAPERRVGASEPDPRLA